MKQIVTAVAQNKMESWVFGLCGVLFVMTALYIYFLSASVVHVVMRQEVSRSIIDNQTHVAGLENSYMEAEHRLSANVANLNGYTKVEKKVFLSRVPGTLVFKD